MDEITYTLYEFVELMDRTIEWLVFEGWVGHNIIDHLNDLRVVMLQNEINYQEQRARDLEADD